LIADSIYKSGRFLIPVLLVWCIAGIGIAFIFSNISAMPLYSSMLMILPSMVINIVLSMSGRFICRFFPATWSNFYKTLTVQLIFCSTSTGIWFFVWYVYESIIITLFPSIFTLDIFFRSVPFVLVSVVLINIIFILIHYVILFIEKNRLASEEILQNKLSLAETELEALKSTIHPHFLFNSLSMLRSMITRSPEKATETLSLLSEFLLYSVQFSRKKEVTINEEVTHAKNYCDIELLRRSNSFSVVWSIDKECHESIVIPFIIQPLVENAIKHGVGSFEQGGNISISVEKSGLQVKILVKNSVGPSPAQMHKSGTGLYTLSRRISSAFGSAGVFLIDNKGNEFVVSITVPLNKGTLNAH
jgi:two-component system, LytTR family, sensor kinase